MTIPKHTKKTKFLACPHNAEAYGKYKYGDAPVVAGTFHDRPFTAAEP
jgi:hypothetical protein